MGLSILFRPLIHTMCIFLACVVLFWLTNKKTSQQWRWTWMISWNEVQISTHGKLVTLHAERSQRSTISLSMFLRTLTVMGVPANLPSLWQHPWESYMWWHTPIILTLGRRRQEDPIQSWTPVWDTGRKNRYRRTAVKLSTLCWHRKDKGGVGSGGRKDLMFYIHLLRYSYSLKSVYYWSIF